MPKLRERVLNIIQFIGDCSGCHQLPERSFFYRGRQFPVCARCTGVFVGQVLMVLLFIFGIRVHWAIGVALLLIMGADWFIQYIGLKVSDNIRRLITGLMGGFGLVAIYSNILLWILSLFK